MLKVLCENGFDLAECVQQSVADNDGVLMLTIRVFSCCALFYNASLFALSFVLIEDWVHGLIRLLEPYVVVYCSVKLNYASKSKNYEKYDRFKWKFHVQLGIRNYLRYISISCKTSSQFNKT